ncbi:hypothetical protein K458DRAFT_393769 [Lentithecium fluviatile CBS 122367]|uniref:Uncharacterized protein n=1 Tax=Lentithecium fluviatile CBS 122367 TaxID=1168545 RepID=A0A6G1INT1_9PLEO|nr:hypothetical protein K458DRAFT_393769 [Lentithecium fluviatile CBS 122367]
MDRSRFEDLGIVVALTPEQHVRYYFLLVEQANLQGLGKTQIPVSATLSKTLKDVIDQVTDKEELNSPLTLLPDAPPAPRPSKTSRDAGTLVLELPEDVVRRKSRPLIRGQNIASRDATRVQRVDKPRDRGAGGRARARPPPVSGTSSDPQDDDEKYLAILNVKKSPPVRRKRCHVSEDQPSAERSQSLAHRECHKTARRLTSGSNEEVPIGQRLQTRNNTATGLRAPAPATFKEDM